MATAENPNPPPISIIEKHGLTEISVHCHVEYSQEQLARINSKLHEAGQTTIPNRRHRLRWATPGETERYWEFRIEAYTIADQERHSRSLHFLVDSHRLIRGVPTAQLRSARTIRRIRTLVEALSQEELTSQFDCNLTWHSSPETSILPNVLPLNSRFPENSIIQEISGVIGRSTDGTVNFVVDRISTEPMRFHIWLGFQYQQALTPKILTQTIDHGSSMLEKINLWEN